MSKYLLDTNVCVCFLRNKFKVDQKVKAIGLENCAISEITVAELKYGEEYAKLKDGAKFKDQKLDELFEDITIYPIKDALDLYAKEKARLRINGTPQEDDFDLLIGCTAVVNQLVMVTENLKDFKNIQDIDIENWIVRE